MTIKEIAQLAGVSVSTVSKIMNSKDDSISAKTREHVLKIAKDYNYSPYAFAMTPQTKTLTIGVVFRELAGVHTWIPGILKEATRRGYSLLLRESGGSLENELKNISALLAAHVDGVIWEPVAGESLEYAGRLEKAELPYVTIGDHDANSFRLDFQKMGYLAADLLTRKGHTSLACLTDNSGQAEAFCQGYRECLFENQLPLQQELIFSAVDDTLANGLSSHTFSGIVVYRYEDALRLCELLDTLHYDIPHDISIVSLRDEQMACVGERAISALAIPYEAFGAMLTETLVAQIEKQTAETENEPAILLNHERSIDIPRSARRKRVLSIGSINVDNYLNFETLPRTGRTATSSDSSVYPGGKCINEAIGVAKLGHCVSIIGRVGNDVDSDMIYRTIKDFQIDSQGLRRSGDSKTGQAYIFVQKNGDSMISILSGANNLINVQDIKDSERLFTNASYCLIQTEIPMPAVIAAARMAKKYRLTTVVKPSSCLGLSGELLRHIDILVPNIEELDVICPQEGSEKEKAQWLLGQGVGTVIVTLGAGGCRIYEKESCIHVPAADFLPVDNTGAGDAFISALVSYLLYDYDMISAARIATYAAGFSITRQGVSPALIDKNTLEAYLKRNEPELLRES